ncbi:hypothetical protein E1B28_010141 [Marasmius oreades]|uniref:Uncharacterized protein n=1 Tax=Marasmius oreades TaxID=181124 RepID=A0A9P7URH2_9AGAR|nr:uncharacterized protein E1B28_010141 [Marasmius oreades]KAG7091085.1 hypothetical protein E1B28_010141 [Marasmius oreades]
MPAMYPSPVGRDSPHLPTISDPSTTCQKTLRPPIHNPYDKFSQSDFDAWIGGITTTLRQALGHEDEVQAEETDDSLDRLLESVQKRVIEEEERDSLHTETRYAFRKGKGRDPGEGPGLGPGTLAEPIELDSDSDQGEEIGEQNEDEDLWEEEEDEWASKPLSSEDEENTYNHGNAGSSPESSQISGEPHISYVEEEPEEESEDEGDEEEDGEGDEDEDEEGDEEEEGQSEDEEDEEQIVELTGLLHADYLEDEHDEEGVQEEDSRAVLITSDSEEESDENKGPQGEVPTISVDHAVISHPADEAEEERLPDVNAALPYQDGGSFPEQPVDSRDPWAGLQTHAEDFYSGGDVFSTDGSVNPDRLNELEESDIGEFLTPGIVTPNDGDTLSVASEYASRPGTATFPTRRALARYAEPVVNYVEEEAEAERPGAREETFEGEDTAPPLLELGTYSQPHQSQHPEDQDISMLYSDGEVVEITMTEEHTEPPLSAADQVMKEMTELNAASGHSIIPMDTEIPEYSLFKDTPPNTTYWQISEGIESLSDEDAEGEVDELEEEDTDTALVRRDSEDVNRNFRKDEGPEHDGVTEKLKESSPTTAVVEALSGEMIEALVTPSQQTVSSLVQEESIHVETSGPSCQNRVEEIEKGNVADDQYPVSSDETQASRASEDNAISLLSTTAPPPSTSAQPEGPPPESDSYPPSTSIPVTPPYQYSSHHTERVECEPGMVNGIEGQPHVLSEQTSVDENFATKFPSTPEGKQILQSPEDSDSYHPPSNAPPPPLTTSSQPRGSPPHLNIHPSATVQTQAAPSFPGYPFALPAFTPFHHYIPHAYFQQPAVYNPLAATPTSNNRTLSTSNPASPIQSIQSAYERMSRRYPVSPGPGDKVPPGGPSSTTLSSHPPTIHPYVVHNYTTSQNPYMTLLRPNPSNLNLPNSGTPHNLVMSNDPYPANLSTPGLNANEEETDEENQLDEIDPSSSSLTDGESSRGSKARLNATITIDTQFESVPQTASPDHIFTPLSVVSQNSTKGIAHAVPNGREKTRDTTAEEPKVNDTDTVVTVDPFLLMGNGKPGADMKTVKNGSKPPPTESLASSSAHSEHEKTPGTRVPKRKRKSTKDTARKSQAAPVGKGKKPPREMSSISKGKGKQKEVTRQTSQTPSALSSGASVVAKLLDSRSSSVVSGDGSAPTQPSPTPARLKEFVFPKPAPVQPMLHNHSRKPLQHSHRQPMSLQTQIQKRSASFGSPTSGPSSQPIQVPPVRSANSPVTRSNCRYHKISLPEIEDGPSIYFLVPGCSLTDRELIKEEEIIDHGDATSEDSERMVPDIESLDINAYVIGIIRLLVGPDKEQEVYFLPKPGEERARKLAGRKKSTIIWGDSHTATGHPLSPQTPTSQPSSSRETQSSVMNGAPASTNGSTSASVTQGNQIGYIRGSSSPLSSDFTTDEEEGGSDTATGRRSPKADGNEHTSPRKLKRGKQLGHDAAAYTPGSDDKETDDKKGNQRKSLLKRTLKRSRTSEANKEESGDRQNKKVKIDTFPTGTGITHRPQLD